MKKRKIQKLLAVFLAASTSVTAMPAGGQQLAVQD